MKKKLLFYTACITLSSININAAPELSGKTFFHPRAQNTNIARDMVTWSPISYYKNMIRRQHLVTGSLTYNQSVRPLRIARALFGTNRITISGSLVGGRDENDLLADYFGLSQDFHSNVLIEPRIKSVTFTPGYLYNACHICNGLYLKLQLPIAWTNWDLNIDENVIEQGKETQFAAGYMNENAISPTIFSFINALKNKNSAFGSVQERMFGNVDGGSTKTTVAELRAELGYYVHVGCKEDIEFHLLLSAPTGNRPKAINFFEPLVGNAKHWEFGLGASAHTVVWEMDPDQEFIMHGAINLTHLFKRKQTRSFDLNENGFFSRYTLLKEFDENQSPTGTIIPAINITTLSCDVRINIQTDIGIMGMYRRNHMVFAFGYNGWIASKEHIFLNEKIETNKFGIKGIQDTFDTNTNMFDAATQDSATIFGNTFDQQNNVADLQTQFISIDDINVKSAARPLQITHKIFFNIAHHWDRFHNCCDIEPFISFGGEIEFEGINEHNTALPDNTTMGQWGFWITGGLSY